MKWESTWVLDNHDGVGAENQLGGAGVRIWQGIRSCPFPYLTACMIIYLLIFSQGAFSPHHVTEICKLRLVINDFT